MDGRDGQADDGPTHDGGTGDGRTGEGPVADDRRTGGERARSGAPDPGWAALPPAAGAAVMATGILSTGFHLVGRELLSAVAFALTAAVWLVSAAGFTALLLRDRRRWTAAADTPPALTAVAATAVLGVRCALQGWTVPAAALLVLGALLWPGLLVAVVRHLRGRGPGAVFLVSVAGQALTVLAALLAPKAGPWLAWTALVAFLLGLLLYADALVRFDVREVLRGAGDQWIAGGALALSALAASKLMTSGVWTGGAEQALRAAVFVLLVADLCWVVVLSVGELLRPRPGYDVRRWATVFPVGMTAVTLLSVAADTGTRGLEPPGRVLLWVAAGLWMLTAYGSGRRHTARRPHHPAHPPR
ncbi:hypothetical protein [Streptomyces sp. NPDC097619]|uniref:SLAC1 family transporter n=1 Tax=Streptomyces sp. NPDC097619 TaxID=3157228 RepID=UPI00332F716E